MARKKDTPTPLSVAIVTKNEEKRLPDCLRGLTFADEIVVVDSGSSDRTVEVAEASGARVLVEPWRGFSGQKQFAVDQCIHDWVLILDADEKVPEETARAIRKALQEREPGVCAYSFRRRNYLYGRWIRHCGWWPDRVLRLVDRRKGAFDGRPVHERWIPEGKSGDLDAWVEHVSFENYSHLVMKMERYSTVASEELFQAEVKVSALTPVLHGLWAFCKSYLLERGILDGFDGLVISMTNGGGSFLKYAKLKERWKPRRTSP